MRDGRLDDALALAQTLRRTQPVDPFVSFLTATILEAQRRWPDAAVMWDEYLAHTSAPDTACPNVALAYEHAGDSDSALQRYRTCLVSDPDNPDRLADLAGLLAARGQTGEARVLYDRAIALDSSDVVLLAHRAALDAK